MAFLYPEIVVRRAEIDRAFKGIAIELCAGRLWLAHIHLHQRWCITQGIAGVGMTYFGKHLDRGLKSLATGWLYWQ